MRWHPWHAARDTRHKLTSCVWCASAVSGSLPFSSLRAFSCHACRFLASLLLLLLLSLLL
jgi:hypothetical protein